MKTYTSLEHHALDAATKGYRCDDYRRFFTDQLLEGLKSKGYIEVVSGKVSIKLAGMRKLMEFEGLPYD